MYNFEQCEWDNWFYANFFNGPVCVLIEGKRVHVGFHLFDENGELENNDTHY